MGLLPFVVAVASFGVFLGVASTRRIGTYGVETDFYGDYAPDAARLREGKFPLNEFQGPGYPAALSIVEDAPGDAFRAGRLISVGSAALVGLFAFVLFRDLFGDRAGLAAQLLVLVNGIYPSFAVTASTDMFFVALCLAAIVVFLHEEARPGIRVALAAILSGLAFLTRYNGVFLVPGFLVGLATFDSFGPRVRDRIRLAGLFLGIVVLTALPWLYANHRHSGSALFNRNYLNMATLFYGDEIGADMTGDGTALAETRFHSFGDVLRFEPGRIVRRYPVNLLNSIRKSLSSRLVAPLLGLVAILGAILAPWRGKASARLLCLAFLGVCYFLLTALTHWDARYYLIPGVLYAGLAAFAIVRADRWLSDVVRHPRLARAAGIVAFLVFWALSARDSAERVRALIRNEPVEVLDACAYLRKEGVRDARIMARKPHLAAVCGQRMEDFPPVRSLEELRGWLAGHPVDYVVFSDVEAGRRRGLLALRDPAAAPSWLESVWSSSDSHFILYRYGVEAAHQP
jgi:hypothetical protein